MLALLEESRKALIKQKTIDIVVSLAMNTQVHTNATANPCGMVKYSLT